ncbi:MAG: cysteine desulfurase [bacterium]|nr:cysteine desulfurase [bacterium]
MSEELSTNSYQSQLFSERNARKTDFPIFNNYKHRHGQPLIYLDSAASAQKPAAVISALSDFYLNNYANIHRGAYNLSAEATDLFEASRRKVAKFIGAHSEKEIVFTRGATEAINLVAHSYLAPKLQPADEILISEMEHHANIVPWRILCDETGARLVTIPITDEGVFDFAAFGKLLNNKTKLVAVTQASNVLGTITPLRQIVCSAHALQIPVLIDGAQSTPHLPVNVIESGCDFFVFSGHKIYGPTGTGVLYGKSKLLSEMIPYQGGGDMITEVTFKKVTFQPPPQRFEAGTPDIAGVVALSSAIDYLEEIGMEEVHALDRALLDYAMEKFGEFPDFRIIGQAPHKVGVISFCHDNIHAHDIGTLLNEFGIAIRTGHHCAQPLMQRFSVPGTARISFGLYNDITDIDCFFKALAKVKKFLS